MTGRWDELREGHPSRAIDRAAWAEELARLPPEPPLPRGMRLQGRRSAEAAAARLRRVLMVAGLLVLAAGPSLAWLALRTGG